jgi:hypothetical protein
VIVGEGGIVERQESLDVVGIVLNKANEDPVSARRCYRDGERFSTRLMKIQYQQDVVIETEKDRSHTLA